MKVYIGPPVYRWISKVHENHMNKRYGDDTDYKNVDWKDLAYERADNMLQWIYNHSINLYLDRKKPKTKVRIDPYDTWSMDHTLAPIIVPMLKQLKETTHGAPFTDDGDVPEHLCSISAPPKENDYDTDEFHFDRWDWILDEMIWSFEQKDRLDWEGDYYETEPDPEGFLGLRMKWQDKDGMKKHQERMSNGFRLFGKYYEALWD